MSVETCEVGVLRDDKTCVGSGLQLDDRRILTCAHVVNTALGRAKEATGRPNGVLKILPHFQKDPVTARIQQGNDSWSDPPATRASGADLCVLELSEPLPLPAQPILIRAFANPIGHQFRAVGHPQGWDADVSQGIVAAWDTFGLLLLRENVKESQTGFLNKPATVGLIRDGFSGAPVEVEGVVAGLVAQARPTSERTAYMIPASSFPPSVQSLVQTFANPVAEEYPHVGKLWDFFGKKRDQRAGYFDLRLRLVKTFADVLAANRTQEPLPSYQQGIDLQPFELARHLAIGKASGPLSNLLVHAPGGAGKSVFLADLLVSSASVGLVPFFLDLSAASGSPRDDEDQLSAADLLESWFQLYEGFGSHQTLLELAEKSVPGRKPLLVIDGLNQAKRDWARLHARISRLSNRELAGAAIVVADRMVDRGTTAQFNLSVLCPLCSDAYTSALQSAGLKAPAPLSSWRGILSSPLFLDIYLKIAKPSGSTAGPPSKSTPSRSSVLSQYFSEFCGFSQMELSSLAYTAFYAYKQFKRTAVPKESFDRILLENARQNGLSELAPLTERIDKFGLLNQLSKNDVEFRHQVLHDYLAGLVVASAPEDKEELLLRSPAFDALSVDSASSDAIELAVESLQQPAALLPGRETPIPVRTFLAELYDWNYWITVECVMSFDRRGEAPIPDWMRHAFYALNLERQFDPFLHTATRALQLKALIATSSNLSYADSATHDGLMEQLRDTKPLPGSDKPESASALWSEWLGLYLRSAPFAPSALSPLWSDPLFSWTAANVLRRIGIDSSVSAEILRLYEISRSTSDSVSRAASFRWRLVHALGRAPAEQASEPLCKIAFDRLENRHVRYGAIRSLLEITATGASKETATGILTKVTDRLEEVFPTTGSDMLGNIRQQLRRCCAINEPHANGRQGWLEDWLNQGLPLYSELLRKGQALAQNRGLNVEADIWTQWRAAAEKVRTQPSWDERRSAWIATIEKDK